jgi:predicted O-methyltransferase YrrM
MNTILEEIIKTRHVRPLNGGDSIPIGEHCIPDEEGFFLQDLVRKVDPEVTLEVGLAYGVSALFICDALRIRGGTRHIVIDPFQNEPFHREDGSVWDSFGGIGIANLRRAGFGNIVQLIEKPSYLAFPELETAGQAVDFAFIDGWHTFDFTLIDFFYIDHLLRIGGIAAFDDANWPAVRKVCRFVTTNRAYSVVGTCGANSWKRRTAEWLLSTIPFSLSNHKLGIKGRCVAFRKEKNDDRLYSHFSRF